MVIAGAIVIETSSASEMLAVVEPEVLFCVAVMVAVSPEVPTAVAIPVEGSTAILEPSLEDHITSDNILLVPSENHPIAEKFCVVPAGKIGFGGVTVMLFNVIVFTFS